MLNKLERSNFVCFIMSFNVLNSNCLALQRIPVALLIKVRFLEMILIFFNNFFKKYNQIERPIRANIVENSFHGYIKDGPSSTSSSSSLQSSFCIARFQYLIDILFVFDVGLEILSASSFSSLQSSFCTACLQYLIDILY